MTERETESAMAEYYDSYLKQADCIKVGVAFDFQCVEQIVPEVHDVLYDYIITKGR